MEAQCLLISALIRPERLREISLAEWDLLVRQGRSALLLGRLFVLMEERGMIDAVPEQPRRHLHGAWVVADRQRTAVIQEVAAIRKAVARAGAPVVFLKGAAYVLADLPVARGRILSDIDIMVPKAALPDVEAALMLAGWVTSHTDEYDQRYYRQWMHEIPPMQHMKRGTTIDVHHAILPETARVRADSQRMRSAALGIPGVEGACVFAPVDMVLHSATHLFHEGELEKGLRDLVDIECLLRHFGGQRARFWDELLQRAREVGLTRPLYYALRYSTRMLDAPVPESAIAASETWAPPRPVRWLMDNLYLRALRPNHATCSDRLTPAARFALFIRGHWLRMPLWLLAYHLARKALARRKQMDAEP